MAGTLKRIAGPAYLSNSAVNIYTPPAATIRTTLFHIHLANKTSAPAWFSLYVGATGASAGGTELFFQKAIGANDVYDFWCNLDMESVDFLTGLASAANTITITVEGEQNVV